MWNEKDANLRNARADWRRVASDVAYVRMLMAGKRWVEAVKREEKFNPNHDELGRFATADGAGSGGGGQVLSDANPDNYFPPGTQVANNDSGGDPNKPGMGHNKPPNPPENNPEQPPQIPEERPPLGRERFRIVKEVAKYLARYGQTLAKIGRGAGWIYEFYPYIKSYLDQPKSLDELQAAVSNPETGYDI